MKKLEEGFLIPDFKWIEENHKEIDLADLARKINLAKISVDHLNYDDRELILNRVQLKNYRTGKNLFFKDRPFKAGEFGKYQDFFLNPLHQEGPTLDFLNENWQENLERRDVCFESPLNMTVSTLLGFDFGEDDLENAYNDLKDVEFKKVKTRLHGHAFHSNQVRDIFPEANISEAEQVRASRWLHLALVHSYENYIRFNDRDFEIYGNVNLREHELASIVYRSKHNRDRYLLVTLTNPYMAKRARDIISVIPMQRSGEVFQYAGHTKSSFVGRGLQYQNCNRDFFEADISMAEFNDMSVKEYGMPNPTLYQLFSALVAVNKFKGTKDAYVAENIYFGWERTVSKEIDKMLEDFGYKSFYTQEFHKAVQDEHQRSYLLASDAGKNGKPFHERDYMKQKMDYVSLYEGFFEECRQFEKEFKKGQKKGILSKIFS